MSTDSRDRWRLPRTSHRLARNGGKGMTNELDRLMTITDLSEMLGVPFDTLYGWRHRGEGSVGHRIGRHVRSAGEPSRLGLIPKRTGARGNVAHMSGVAFSSAMPPNETVRLCTSRCLIGLIGDSGG
jgi:hypothetical protein